VREVRTQLVDRPTPADSLGGFTAIHFWLLDQGALRAYREALDQAGDGEGSA
jgi:hypothetical protein